MRLLRAAARVERSKAAGSAVGYGTSLLLVIGILGLSVSMTLAAHSDNPQMAAKVGPLADEEGWTLLVGVVSMICAPACLLGFGVMLSWMFGREFADGTISGLFALPVSRRVIAAAKLGTFLAWASAIALALTTGTALLGLALGYGAPSGADAVSLARLPGVVVMTGLLAVPAGWISTVGRGLLPGIAACVCLITMGQVFAVAGTGAWFPVAAPALWAMAPDRVSGWQLLTVPLMASAFVVLTLDTWQRLQLDR